MNPSTDFMESFFHNRISFFFYRYRFLLVYILIGISSIVIEIIIFRSLTHFGLPEILSQLCGVICGFVVAYFLNIRFNFKVPHGKRKRAFVLFILISTGSFFLNMVVRSQFVGLALDYEHARVITSGMLFILAYILHRKFTFSDAKQVGIAVYANKVEDIESIRRKVGLFPDFIHIDVVDNTFREGVETPNTHRIEVAHAYWPQKQIHVHVMSSTPSQYLDEILPFVDVVVLHVECDEDLFGVIDRIHAKGKRVGLCVLMTTSLEKIRSFAGKIDMLMLLSILKPGNSGQTMELSVVERIEEIQHWPERKQFELCVDGGVNEHTISLLNVEKVVSGSSVLNNANPTRQIMRLQTSSNYEAV